MNYSRSDAGVAVNLADGAAAGGHAEGDAIANFENVWGSIFADQFTGSDNDESISGLQGADALNGGGGKDRLWGNEGDDILTGGPGADILIGGAGKDIFVIRASDRDTEVIFDFTQGEDRIDLSDFEGMSFSDLIISGETIDLSSQGGGKVSLRKVEAATLAPADFLFD